MIGVFLHPYMDFLKYHLSGLENVQFFYKFPDIQKSNCTKKIIFDFIITPPNEVRKPLVERVQEYSKSFHKIVILNSDYIDGFYNDIEETFSKIDNEKVSLVTTGIFSYVPKYMKVYRHETFFGNMSFLYRDLALELDTYSEKSFYFDVLLGLKRPHREWVFDNINKYSPEKFFVKYYKFYNKPLGHEIDFEIPDGIDNDNTNPLNTRFFSGMTVSYKGVQTNLSHIIPIDIYNKTAYSIVTETTDTNKYNLYTEKTAKTLLGKRLTVFFAGMHHLKNLRSLGFSTFDGIIDESYDSEPDPIKRRQMAFEQVKFLCEANQREILEAARPILDHNYHHFKTTDWISKMDSDIKDCVLN